MSTFSVWLTAHEKDPQPKRVLWVCGPERVLVDDVVQQTVGALNLRPWSEWRFVVGEDKETDIWDALRNYPLELEDQVVVVYGANRIKDWSPLKNFFSTLRLNPRMHLVLVSDSDRAERDKGDREQGIRPQLLPHLAAIQAKGRIVECKRFTEATSKNAVRWVQSRANVSQAVAAHILNRTSGDLRAVRDLCVKVSVLPQVSNAEINALCAAAPTASFADSLMVLDRKTSLLALERLSDTERTDALYELSSRLDTARAVNELMAARSPKVTIRAMLQEKGQAHTVDHLMDTAKYYHAKRGLGVRRILDAAIRAHEQGARGGVLESVIAVW